MVHRALDILSTDQYLEIQLKHIRSRRNKINGLPDWVIFRVFVEVKEKQLCQQSIAQKPDEDNKNPHCFILPYNDLKEEHVIKTMGK